MANVLMLFFCTDLNLGWGNLVDYYRLIFQIEFNFRDAKQHWGLRRCYGDKEGKSSKCS